MCSQDSGGLHPRLASAHALLNNPIMAPNKRERLPEESADRISCGPAVVRTSINQTWLPFVPGTRYALPEDRGLQLDDAPLPRDEVQMLMLHPAWQFAAATQDDGPAFGAISPDNRWVITADGMLCAFATRGRRPLRIVGPVPIAEAEAELLNIAEYAWGADSDHALVLTNRATIDGRDVPALLICVHVVSGAVRWVIPTPDYALRMPVGPACTTRGARLMAAATSNHVLLFDPHSGAMVDNLDVEASDGSAHVALSSDGSRLLVVFDGERPAEVRRLPEGDVIAQLTAPGRPSFRDHAISACNRYALVCGQNSAVIYRIGGHTGRRVELPKVVDTIMGRVLAVTPGMTHVVIAIDNEMRVLHLRPDADDAADVVRVLWTRSGMLPDVYRLARLSPDGTLLALQWPTCEVWELATGELLTSPSGWRTTIESVAWLADSETLLTNLGTLVNADTGRPFAAIPQLAGDRVAVSADGKLAAASRELDELCVVNMEDRRAPRVLIDQQLQPMPPLATACPLTFSPDGSCIAFGDRVISTADGTQICRLRPSPQRDDLYPRAAAFSPDGRRLAMLGTRLVVLDAFTGEELMVVPASRNRQRTHLGFSPDGEHVVVMHRDGAPKWTHVRSGKTPADPGCPLHVALPDAPLGVLGPSEVQHLSLSPDRQRLAALFRGRLCLYRST